VCGIAGLLSFDSSANATHATVSRMVAAMRHRGPDGAGVLVDGACTLGHARLAVIDTTEAGRQPMSKQGVHLVYNGELYNFQDQRLVLEEDGFTFVGRSDAEVLLALYLRHGESFLGYLRGMYAFALYDARTQTLLCARDPLGIKPFLYARNAQGFIFASELKALLASGLVSREVNRQGLHALLRYGSVPQASNILSEVHWLPPGHVLSLRPRETPSVRQFRAPRTGMHQLGRASWLDVVDQGKELITNAVRRQLVADVPIGAFLSGGIDSSLLVALMRQAHGHVRTFSVGFETGLETQSEDETDDATDVARHLDVHHTRVVVRQEDVARNLRNIAKALDHPTVDGVNSWFVSQAARKELTVAISGTGGDELFAGYPWFGAMQSFTNAPWSIRLSRRLRGETFLKAFDAQYHIFDHAAAARLCPDAPAILARPDPLRQAEPLSRVTGLLLNGYTRDQLLADIDTAAMWHGLEVRVPLLDEPVVDFALSLQPEAKIGGCDLTAPEGSYAHSGVKRILAEIGRQLLPSGFLYRRKRGFTLPFDGWLRSVLSTAMEELLAPSTVSRRGFFSAEVVAEVHWAFLRGAVHWTKPWLLMATELWAQEVLDA